jgi:hypothetical protein
MVRLVNSGTEAVMSAIRIARGYTKRDKIIKFEGCYHGHSDSMLVKAGSGALTTGVADSAGVPEDFAMNTLVASYNDEKSVERLFELNREQNLPTVKLVTPKEVKQYLVQLPSNKDEFSLKGLILGLMISLALFLRFYFFNINFNLFTMLFYILYISTTIKSDPSPCGSFHLSPASWTRGFGGSA